MNAKASNAVVAVVDFYAGELAAARAHAEQLEGVVKMMGETLKSTSQRAQLEGVVVQKARALIDDWDRHVASDGGPMEDEAELGDLRASLAVLDAAETSSK